MAESPTAREAIAHALRENYYLTGDGSPDGEGAVSAVIAAIGTLSLAEAAILLRDAGYGVSEWTDLDESKYLRVAKESS